MNMDPVTSAVLKPHIGRSLGRRRVEEANLYTPRVRDGRTDTGDKKARRSKSGELVTYPVPASRKGGCGIM